MQEKAVSSSDVASIFKNEVRTIYHAVCQVNQDGIIVMDEKGEEEFLLGALQRTKDAMPYYEREYFAMQKKSEERQPLIKLIDLALYVFIKSTIHASVFKVNENTVEAVFKDRKTIPELLLHPNELLSWKIIYAVYMKMYNAESEPLTPFFSEAHCVQHRLMSMQMLTRAADGHLSEISVFLPQYLMGSLQPFHRLSTDALTTLLLERNAFSLSVEDFCYSGMSVGLILLDIDYFSQVNNDNGHSDGDECLLQISKILYDICIYENRKGIAGRCGGEEFRLAFPEANKEELLAISAEINCRLHAIDRTHIPDKSKDAKIVGVSDYSKNKFSGIKNFMSASMGCGVIQLIADLDYDSMCLKLSDIYDMLDKQGVYAAKNQGRDTFVYVDLSK